VLAREVTTGRVPVFRSGFQLDRDRWASVLERLKKDVESLCGTIVVFSLFTNYFKLLPRLEGLL